MLIPILALSLPLLCDLEHISYALCLTYKKED